MAEPLTLTRRQVAALFGRAPGWVSRRRVDLEARGFPKRLAGTTLWPREAVEAWIGQRAQTAGVVDTDTLREELRARAEQLA